MENLPFGVCHLTISHIQVLSGTSIVDEFWKHCEKKVKSFTMSCFSFCHNVFQFYSIITLFIYREILYFQSCLLQISCMWEWVMKTQHTCSYPTSYINWRISLVKRRHTVTVYNPYTVTGSLIFFWLSQVTSHLFSVLVFSWCIVLKLSTSLPTTTPM